ncbi:MAG: metal ABC transporter permease [Ignavibacteria bacterium]|nr:metal ABC transporter permease [Ignavibacteria bacterium]
MDVIKQIIELFPYAVAGSILAGMICSFLGVFVVSQRAVFLGGVLTQASLAGVAFSFFHVLDLEGWITKITGVPATHESYFHHFEPVFFSLLFAITAVVIFSQSYRNKKITQDIVLGLIFIISVALRIIFTVKSPVGEAAEIESIMKGDLLFINFHGFITLLIVTIMVLGIFLLFRKQLQFVTFDIETAQAHGLKARFWLFLFYLAVGIGISITTRLVGDVFTFAFLVIPASIGLLGGRRVNRVFLIAILFAGVVPPVSLYFAFITDLPSGPTSAAVAFSLFLFFVLIRKLYHIIRKQKSAITVEIS